MSAAESSTARKRGEPKRERVRAAPLLRRAARTLRRHPGRVVGVAAMLAVPLTIVEAVVLDLSNLEIKDDWGAWLTVVAIIVVGSLSSVFFWEFYAGLLDRVCLEDQHGHARYGVGETFRTLPYRRLVTASLIVWALYLVGSSIAEVPAMVALSFFAIVGPVINSEGQPVWRAMRRSAGLVSHSFWITTLLITIPLIAEGWIAWAVQDALDGHSHVLQICIEVVIVSVLTPVIGVVEVTLAHELMRRDPLPGEAGEIWRASPLNSGSDSPRNDGAVSHGQTGGIAVVEADVPGATSSGGVDGATGSASSTHARGGAGGGGDGARK